jgi:ribosomal-protein-alanine N-acetyltransferase
MTGNDLSDVHALESACDPSPWSVNALRHEIDNKESILKVAVRDNNVIGYMCIRTLLDITHVMKINVLPGCRRNGTGSALLIESLKKLRSLKPDVKHVTLEVRESNSAAINLYNKFGFRKSGVRKNYYKNPSEDGFVMQMDL